MRRDLLLILVCSLVAAIGFGVLLFFDGPGRHAFALEIAFGLAAAIFLGSLIVILLERAAETVDDEVASEGRTTKFPNQSEGGFTHNSVPTRFSVPTSQRPSAAAWSPGASTFSAERTMSNLITGVFNDSSKASSAVNRLHAAGFSTGDISVLTSESTSDHAFAVKTGSKVGEGAAIGAGLGGAVIALLAGLTTVGVVATGGIGLVAAGPIVAALAGAGAGAAAGGLVGGLIGLGIPEHEAKYYEGIIEKGGVLIGVKAEGERRDIAKDIFKECGAETISRA